jgi:hypothetical protein
MWAGKQEKVRPLQECFFLTFLFIELIRQVKFVGENENLPQEETLRRRQ